MPRRVSPCPGQIARSRAMHARADHYRTGRQEIRVAARDFPRPEGRFPHGEKPGTAGSNPHFFLRSSPANSPKLLNKPTACLMASRLPLEVTNVYDRGFT